jgi:chromosome segregation ATPase
MGDVLTEDKGKNEATTANPPAQPAHQRSGAQGQPQPQPSKIDEIRKSIDEEKKKIPPLIESVKRSRHRLSYKIAEKAAMSKLAAMSKDNTKEIGYLRRRKESMEFRIATEAFTLEAEKDLIRKKNEIEIQLNDALKSYRLKRKVGYIDKDIEDLTKNIADIEAKIAEVDKKLDELYSNLRKITGQMRKPRSGPRPEKRTSEPKPAEISLADIAIIKDNTNPKHGGNNDGA